MTDPATPTLELSIEGPLGILLASNPQRMNAFTAAMWRALPDCIARAEADPGVRVIVLRGAGDRAFSAGADISEFDSARTGDNALAYDALNHAAFTALSGAGKPTIAMIHGFCLGGGLGLAACCDLRLCDEAAQFSIPAARLGIGYNPRWVGPLLAITSATRVKEILFTGRRFSAAEALQMGLVSKVLPNEALEAETRALAATIAANAPLSVSAAKLVVDELVRNARAPDLAKLDRAVKACFDSEDYAEGRRAFLEKRAPRFSGR